MSCFVSLADRPIVELVVDPHESNMCDSLTSSAQHQSERFALILLKESMFVEKHHNSDKKKFFRSLLRDWLSRDDNKPSVAVSPHTWHDTNVSVSQAGRNGAALVNSTCVRDSCSSGELTCHNFLKANTCKYYSETCIKWPHMGQKM